MEGRQFQNEDLPRSMELKLHDYALSNPIDGIFSLCGSIVEGVESYERTGDVFIHRIEGRAYIHAQSAQGAGYDGENVTLWLIYDQASTAPLATRDILFDDFNTANKRSRPGVCPISSVNAGDERFKVLLREDRQFIPFKDISVMTTESFAMTENAHNIVNPGYVNVDAGYLDVNAIPPALYTVPAHNITVPTYTEAVASHNINVPSYNIEEFTYWNVAEQLVQFEHVFDPPLCIKYNNANDAAMGGDILLVSSSSFVSDLSLLRIEGRVRVSFSDEISAPVPDPDPGLDPDMSRLKRERVIDEFEVVRQVRPRIWNPESSTSASKKYKSSSEYDDYFHESKKNRKNY